MRSRVVPKAMEAMVDVFFEVLTFSLEVFWLTRVEAFENGRGVSVCSLKQVFLSLRDGEDGLAGCARMDVMVLRPRGVTFFMSFL